MEHAPAHVFERKTNHPCQRGRANVALPRTGFCRLVLLVLRLVPQGLLMGGPPCGSYVFINRSTSRRSRARPFGDCRKQYVRDANACLL